MLHNLLVKIVNALNHGTHDFTVEFNLELDFSMDVH